VVFPTTVASKISPLPTEFTIVLLKRGLGENIDDSETLWPSISFTRNRMWLAEDSLQMLSSEGERQELAVKLELDCDELHVVAVRDGVYGASIITIKTEQKSVFCINKVH